MEIVCIVVLIVIFVFLKLQQENKKIDHIIDQVKKERGKK